MVFKKYKKCIKKVLTIYKNDGKLKISKEDKRMKKRKLRKWVKVVLLVIALVGLVKFNEVITKDAIRDCVNAGNDYNMCEKGLR